MRVVVFLCTLLLSAGGAAHAQSPAVAGTTPDRRPEGAPRIENVQRDDAWSARFHRGVDVPFPPNLGSRDQGAWYTPFNRPGMLPPYDLRGWHEAAPGPR